MTLDETLKALSIIAEIWPSFLRDRNPASTQIVWQRLFADESYDVVDKAIMAFAAIDQKGFPPSPGALKEQIRQMLEAKADMTEGEAWARVSKAIRNGLYGYREEYQKLPEIIRQAVGSDKLLHEWAMLDEETVESVIASNFQRSYRARKQTAHELDKLPQSLREALPGFSRIGIAADANPPMKDAAEGRTADASGD